jgi:hypothetical protein
MYDNLERYPSSAMVAPVLLALVFAPVVWLYTGRRREPVRIALSLLVGMILAHWSLWFPAIPFSLFLFALLGATLIGAMSRRACLWFPFRRLGHTLTFALFSVVLLLGFPLGMAQVGVWHLEALSTAGFGTDSIRVARAPYPRTTGDPVEVARAYRPIYLFSPGERWRPTPVEEFLRDPRAKIRHPSKPPEPARLLLQGPPRGCSTMSDGCYVTLDCRHPDRTCADETSEYSVVYARVVDNPLEKEGRRALREPLIGLTRLIQYWTFYRYDDWRGWNLRDWFALFRQWHEGDWEVVTVGFDARKPLYVAYSSHCGGLWRRWHEAAGYAAEPAHDPTGPVGVAPGHPPGHHPLVFVAKGSHGAYPDDAPRAPDWASCKKEVPDAWKWATVGPTFGGGVRETMNHVSSDEDDLVGPQVILIREDTPFLKFVGRWAEADHLKLIRGNHRTGGPPTPTQQSSWKTPLAATFCASRWRPAGHCPPKVRREAPPRSP